MKRIRAKVRLGTANEIEKARVELRRKRNRESYHRKKNEKDAIKR